MIASFRGRLARDEREHLDRPLLFLVRSRMSSHPIERVTSATLGPDLPFAISLDGRPEWDGSRSTTIFKVMPVVWFSSWIPGDSLRFPANACIGFHTVSSSQSTGGGIKVRSEWRVRCRSRQRRSVHRSVPRSARRGFIRNLVFRTLHISGTENTR